MRSENQRDYYSTSDAARRLGVSRQRIDQLLKSGELEGEKDPTTGRWRILSEAFNEYLSSHQPRTPRRRLEDHPAFKELKGEVEDLNKRLSSFEVRLGVVEQLLAELRSMLLGSIYDKETDGAVSKQEKQTRESSSE